MMKKYIHILVSLAVLALAGCNKEEHGQALKIMEIISSDVSFPADGGSGEVHFRIMEAGHGEVGAEPSKSWVSITEIQNDAVIFSVSPSDEALARSADIRINIADESYIVTILQSGAVFYLEGENEIIELDPTGVADKALVYDTTGDEDLPSVSTTADWLDVTVNEEAVILDAELNLTNGQRSAEVQITSGWKTAVLHVTQSPASAFPMDSIELDADAYASRALILEDYVAGHLPDWSIESEDAWIDIEVSGNSFIVNAEENQSGILREGTVCLVSAGKVISSILIRQSFVSYNDLAGEYSFIYDGTAWVWELIADGDGKDAFRAKITRPEGPATEGYSLKLGFILMGEEDAPKMTLSLPQNLSGTEGDKNGFYLRGAVSATSGYYINVNVGFDLVYNIEEGVTRLDFKPDAKTYASYPQMNTIWLTENGNGVGWCAPAAGADCIYLTKRN